MPHETLMPLTIFIFGAMIGSFLNVCIFRIPNRKSVVFPPSRCMHCDSPIRFYDNIPILSWFWLFGKCRHCRGAISFQYPLVEALNAAGFIYLYSLFGLSGQMFVYAVFLSALLVVTFIDLRHQIIPDVISLPGIVVGLLASLWILPHGFMDAFFGAALGWGLFYLIAIVSRGGMGGGDVKLIAMIGAFLGWQKMLLTIMLGAFSGSIVGILLMIFFGKGRKYAVPFGPFLSLGAVISLFWGTGLIYWYLHAM